MNKRYVFVLGDLAIEHTVFVRALHVQQHESAGGQWLHEVDRRQDTAGGAATCARVLSVINEDGKTFLWGIVGRSLWGDFRRILEASQLFDNASSNVEFRATRDESDAPMSTVTRLVSPEARIDGVQQYQVHGTFHDCGNTHVTKNKRRSAAYYLERVRKHTGLSAIILYDLEFGALDADLLKLVSRFAARHDLPLFVDPKRNLESYSDVAGVAILPNIHDWCCLVGESNPGAASAVWRRKIATVDGLREFASKSLFMLRKYKYHIVKFDKDGLVLLAPRQAAVEHACTEYEAFWIKPHPQAPLGREQLGCGDVITAVVAYHYAPSRGSESMREAVMKANAAVAAYRRAPWHRMPSVDQLENIEPELVPAQPDARVSAALMFVPSPDDPTVDLGRYRTAVPKLSSGDSRYRAALARFLTELQSGWDNSAPKHFVLVGPPGEGKSIVLSSLAELLPEYHVSNQPFSKLELRSDAEFSQWVGALAREAAGKRTIMIMDEVGKAPPTSARPGLVLLFNAAKEFGVRCVLASQEFFPDPRAAAVFNPRPEEILGRCLEPFTLPPLTERPSDIQCVIATEVTKKGGSVSIRADAFAELVKASLGRSARAVSATASAAYERASRRWNELRSHEAHVIEIGDIGAAPIPVTESYLKYVIKCEPAIRPHARS